MAHSVPINLDGTALPSTIQLLPPGVSRVRSHTAEGEAVWIEAHSTEEQALRIQGQIADMRQEAEDDNGIIPFIDFGHAGAASAAEVTGCVWGGEDRKGGGIRLVVEWSALGAFAILGKIYRRFSPVLYVDRGTNLIVGLGPLIGGLTNRPAFFMAQRIAPPDGPVGRDRAIEFQDLVKQAVEAAHTDPVAVAAEQRPDLFRSWFLLQPDAPLT